MWWRHRVQDAWTLSGDMKNMLLCFIFVLVSVAFQTVGGNSQGSQSLLHRNARSVHRVKRTVLTTDQSYEIVNIHNYVRSLEGASDMQSMRYNGLLATMADAYAQLCRWYHGQAYSTPTALGYPYVGQNLYAVSGTDSVNITNATLYWYNEKQFYDYNTMTCQPNQMCGHYTQVVWASTYEIGCAINKCPILNQSSLSSPFLLVCNYGPAGNIDGQKPYQIGAACTQCNTQQYWCSQGLCNSSCTMSPGPNCVCSLNCQNNGTLVSSNCSCQCASGWDGFDCSTPCQNSDPLCDPAPGSSGWPPYYCTNVQYGATIRQKCRLMCGECLGSAANFLLAKLSTTFMLSSIVSLLFNIFNLRY